MKTDLERDDFLALLEKLKSDENSEILTAVRDINDKMSVAGVSWDNLLISQGEDKVNHSDLEDDYENEDQEIKDDNLEPLSDEESKEALSLIKAISNLKISAATKQELDEYKEDLKEGEFEKMDLRYLRALKARLSD